MGSQLSTIRVYLEDGDCLQCEAVVAAVEEGGFVCDRSPFYPGGGGQPCDLGWADEDAVTGIRVGEGDELWHASMGSFVVGQRVRLRVDGERRAALTRYHTVLHVLNTITLRDYSGWITGVQIGVDYSRIDFRLEGLTPALCAELEERVNAVLRAGHAISARYISEEEFAGRPELLRSLEARPPVKNGRVRIVEIAGFDVQCCGGTHVHSLGELGRFSIFKTENKGRINKRLYVRLER